MPFHALPRLHEKLKDHIYVEKGGGVSGGARIGGDILKQIFRNSKIAEV